MSKYYPVPSSQYTQKALSKAVDVHLGELAEIGAITREVVKLINDEIGLIAVTGGVTMANVVRASDHLRWDMAESGHGRPVFHDFMDKLEQITGESILMVTATGQRGMVGHLLRSRR